MEEKTTITHEDFLELSSDIAEAIVVNRIGNLDLVWVMDENKTYHFTEEAQDIFNENLGMIQHCLRKHLTNQ
jgi:hypothetical protein